MCSMNIISIHYRRDHHNERLEIEIEIRLYYSVPPHISIRIDLPNMGGNFRYVAIMSKVRSSL